MGDRDDTTAEADRDAATAEADRDAATAEAIPEAPKVSIWKIALRLAVTVAALAISAFVLWGIFDDLDIEAVLDALDSLNDAELMALGCAWIIWLACQGLQTSALVGGLPVRRGILAYLGPAAVSSLIPGPSDLPVRYRMFMSWGYTAAEAGLAVAAGGIFSIGVKLVLPVVAAVGLVLSDEPLEGTLRTIVSIVLLIGLVLAVAVVVLGSEKRTATAGRVLDPVWRLTLRLLRRDDPEHLATRLVEARAEALATLRGRWLIATWGTALTAATRFILLLMAIRFTGTPEEVLDWRAIFVVYALVQGLTALPITAGNAGVSEIAYIGMLTAAAGQEWVNQITAGVILFRVITWIAMIPAGLIALGIWRYTTGGRQQVRAPTVTPGS